MSVKPVDAPDQKLHSPRIQNQCRYFTSWIGGYTPDLVPPSMLHFLDCLFYAQLFSTIWTLSTSHYHVADPAAILQQRLNILHCQLELYLHSELIDDMDITLACMREFMLKDPSVGRVNVNFLQAFIAPALCTLEIPERFLGTTPIETLAAFISTSGCKPQVARVTEKRGRKEKCPLPHTARHFLQFQFSLPVVKIRTTKNSEEPEGKSRSRKRDSISD
ncbi:hypothetical protein B0H17DRAFT_1143595 [Mycena rosella]|uniref:Uncharacterized protein n=1 Tax=Mycena rosella TaxID=1033263 RepID=A0AAD7G3T3_MYCRO|nr:hypothetical protein B0H17DRAFT_1143595 [Mycena rosella]